MKAVLATTLVLLGAAPHAAAQATGGDRTGVTRAALDYLEGFYEGDSVKFVRSVRPDMYKIGFYRPRDSTRYASPEHMSWEEALTFIRNVREMKHFAPATAPKEVAILDLLDQTAAVKVTAWWGTDYLLLGRYDGRWAVSHVLWQSRPPTPVR
jgi:hypothetical protein